MHRPLPRSFSRLSLGVLVAAFGVGCSGDAESDPSRASGGAGASGGSAGVGATGGGAGASGSSGSAGSAGAGGLAGAAGSGGMGSAGAAGSTGIDPTSCDCDREILPSEAQVDISGIGPGSVLCVRANTASERGSLRIVGMTGTAQGPILLRNCDGQVHFTSSGTSPALSIPSGSHFRVSGAGAVGVEHGLLFSAPGAPQGIALSKVSDYEIDHVEIDSSSFAGIMAKVDPSSADCQLADRRYDDFVMRNVSIHHNYIHDVDGEGLYLGNSFFDGTTVYCGQTQYPHEVRGVRVTHNRFERTGWDSIQVGSAVEDCQIKNNVVRDWATVKKASQENGIQVGGGSSCEVAYNLLIDGQSGMHIAGIGNSFVHDNVIAGYRTVGIFVNPRPTPLASDIIDKGYVGGFSVVDNTLIAAGDAAPSIRDVNVPNNPVPAGNIVVNNLIVSQNSGYLQLTPSYAWDNDKNLRFSSTAAAGLSAAANEDYCLAAGSAGVDAGRTLSDPRYAADFLGGPRPKGAGYDVGALECR